MRTLVAVTASLMMGLASVGCQATGGTPMASPQSFADELLAADRAASDRVRSETDVAVALSRMMADDVTMRAGGSQMIRGRAQAQAALAVLNEAPGQVSWTPVRAGISADGLHGFTYGFMTVTRQDGTVTALKYLSYWVKRDGQWNVMAFRQAPRPNEAVSTTVMPAILPGMMVPPVDDAAQMNLLQEGLAGAERAFSDEAQQLGLRAAFANYGTAESMNIGGPLDAGFVIGADNVARAVAEGEPATGSSVRWSSERTIVASSGDLGVSFGDILINVPEGAPERPPIPFFTIWHRPDSSSPWRYIAE